MTIHLANGQPVGEYELDMIARAFGFTSHLELERVCREGDAKRMARSIGQGGTK